MIANIISDKEVIAYAEAIKISSILTGPNTIAYQNIPLKVHVGDIEIAYRIFGKGKPLLLTAGFGATMVCGIPRVLKQFSANHTIIVFDNRGKNLYSRVITSLL